MRALRKRSYSCVPLVACVIAGLAVGCSDSTPPPKPGAGPGTTTNGSSGEAPGAGTTEGPKVGSNDTPAPLPSRPADVLQPLDVQSYYGTYDVEQKDIGLPSRSLDGPVTETWPDPPKPNKPYKIGVLFPHFRDPYWIPVDYGIIAQAMNVGVSIRLLDADGYQNLGAQRKQLTSDLVKEGVDGIILASIDYEKLDDSVEDVVKQGIPVIEVINDIRAPAIKAKALVSFHQMGYAAGTFVLRDSAGKDVKVAFFPGPEGAGWAEDSLLGFKKAIQDNPEDVPKGEVEILPEAYGKTEPDVQRARIRSVLGRHTNVDYLVGNAVMADAAISVIQDADVKNSHPNVKIVGSYIIPDVYDKIEAGLIAAAPSDLTVDQGRMAVDMMVRLLNGETPGDKQARFPFRSGPVIQVISKETMGQWSYERLFGPRGFKPVFRYDPPEGG